MTSWTAEGVAASEALAEELGQGKATVLAPGEFIVASRSKPHMYRMARTPEGVAFHQGEDCEGARFKGPFGCWHSRENTIGDPMTTALVRAESVLSPAPIAFNTDQMQVITQTICKGATPQELQLFVATCTRTGLDPFMRQIYAVKRWDSREKKEVMAIQVGIDGMRLIAERTGKYGGQDPVEWLDTDGVWSEVWTGRGDFPVAARCSVYRKDWPSTKATAVCRWDSYAQFFGNPAKLSPTWDKMPDVMLAKCAESLALRKAFPAEMSAIAAAVDTSYDPAYDLEIQQETPAFTPPADAIEGESREVRDEESKPERAVAMITDTQRQSIADWIEGIKADRSEADLKACQAWARARFPYAIEANKFLSSTLTEEDAASFIDVLRACCKEGSLPAAQAQQGLPV